MEESNNTKPLISIITVVLNDKDNIEKTILSVLNQNYKNIQYIIIDGGSSDGTIDIIKKYEKNIGFWVSEKDKGIYDAFNKGLKHTNGDLIGFTNSGDTLTNESLDYLVDYYNNYKEADFFFGAVKKHWGILHGYKKWKIYFTWGFYSSHSTGFYIKKKAAKILGNYNLKYKYSSDYDYFYRMIIKYKFKGVGTKKKELFG
ncbi:glycosyltransferase, partial [Candidatus Pelagibacter sp.]|nr:glycosyltransferase [Candidatus Pelagibacter sp.]